MSDPQYEKPKTEPLDVVMLKLTANERTATPEEFTRVKVRATDAVAAMHDPAVVAQEKEYRFLCVTPPGYETTAEMQARQRAYNGNVTDPTKIGFGDPIGALPPGQVGR